jgi:hypothetical protein
MREWAKRLRVKDRMLRVRPGFGASGEIEERYFVAALLRMTA